MFIKKLLVLSVLIGCKWGWAQNQTASALTEVADSLAVSKYAENEILNTEVLEPFFQKLNDLKKNQSGKINIVHIGDSHIQADLFTGKIRERLQTEFGNGGLGFSFPYKLAKTNGNSFVQYSSNIEWNSYRNIYPLNGSLVGLSGIALAAKKDDFVIEITMRDARFQFTKMKIFTPGNENMFDVATASKTIMVEQKVPQKINHRIKKGEAIGSIAKKYGVTLEQIKKANSLKGNLIQAGKVLYIPSNLIETKAIARSEFIPLETVAKKQYREFINSEELSKIYLLPSKKAETYNLNGLVFENEQAGIIYHSIGVNGAKFSDYNKYKLFFEQIKGLAPDLVVISLGTNEAFDKMGTANYQEQMNFFIDQIKKDNPRASILITTPPPSLFQKKIPNSYSEGYADSILEDAVAQQYAVWDVFHILGGINSVNENYDKGLVSRDYVHYSKSGYEYKGELFANALLEAFKNFKISHKN
ncbi:GDSL-type esterase/lipase family protein [Flavobacterium sp. NKUCC04_CG]|uniref:LysM peptidoglycan-binding domain-containing protein n=1 Tax=Flavobacterium sp. NKUCC04_CG TaxID=2842121 RepID=UPI001C5B1E44|nr:GDSL-type esterase/lipase family protein [Flavobacterium sp. NKUCC04_CG]MBW3519773.1 LysM peptidoglycan-binding domain-containing protein [Flavobacterium sp. NKUCC04_CG]